jgi:hypothetical protein
VALVPIFIAAAIVDPKIITGAPAWIKPLKFAISGAIYCVTFLWLLSFLQGGRRWVQIMAAGTGIALIVETALIAMQVVRGTTSHFNDATPFDAAVYSTMGGFVMIIAVLNLVLAIWLLFRRLPEPILAWSLRLAVLISFAGMGVGFLMTQPTPAQIAAMEADQPVAAVGAHSVGVEDGGAGLPLVGWSTEGGDLRVGHFIGLHALQIIPLIGWLLTQPPLAGRLSLRRRLVLLWTAALGYLGLAALTTWQALRGQPVIAPDALTLSAFALLVGAVLLVAAAVSIQPRRAQP